MAKRNQESNQNSRAKNCGSNKGTSAKAQNGARAKADMQDAQN